MLMCVVLRATVAVTAAAAAAAVTITAVVTPVTAAAVTVTAPTPACDETAVMAGKNALSNDEDKSSTIPKQIDVMI
jgi:uncharacterized membrane protein